MKYDVVIIGAGPGGIAAAHNLINNNISCLLIDKQKFPRNKLCAGGITSKTFDLLKELKLKKEFTGENTIISEGAELYLEYKYITKIKSKGLTYMVDRFDFDSYLVDDYKDKGGILLEEARVKNIDEKNNIITLGNEETIEFQYIIGADGAVGMTRKLVDKNMHANGFCLQVDVERSKFKYDTDYMSLYYGIIPQGYGWIFPKKSYLTIGFGGDYNKNFDYNGEFEKFLNKLGINCDRKDFKGAFLAFGEHIKNPVNKEKNLLLVGDAAGLVDPITGEGIYFAMLSGVKASNLIIKAIKENSPNEVDKYKYEIENITKNIGKGAKLKKPIYTFRKPIFNAMKNKKIGDFVFNECLYESNYCLLELLFHKNKM
ncbi:MAG: NAD(P)/FAD-dependent oxidoreductase [Terrisporobacter sp.]|uniref:NAD(P)/FAD-dependent oxidoreductase n=1 Tax=Terrisporobacter sp. TaxID=1965305 RepID=UPI002FC94814